MKWKSMMYSAVMVTVGFQLRPPVTFGELLPEEEIAAPLDGEVEGAPGFTFLLLPDGRGEVVDLGDRVWQ